MSTLLLSVNFNIDCDCTKLFTYEVFDDILADRHRTRCELKTYVYVRLFKIQHFITDFIKNDANPFGKLANFWYRIEFQHRGSPHMHCMLCIANAPRYDVDETHDVANYIDSIISRQRSWGVEELENLVSLQIHKRTKTCKNHIRKNVCHFGFPNFPLLTTCILQPLILGKEEKQRNDSLL